MRAVIGNLAVDKIFFQNGAEHPGGPPYYIVKSLKKLGIKKISVVSAIGSDFNPSFFPDLAGVDLTKVNNGLPTTRVGIRKDQEGTEYGGLLAYAGRINLFRKFSKSTRPDIVYVSTVLDEVSPEDIAAFPHSMVCLDIQGFIRKPQNERWNRVSWDDAGKFLDKVRILKMSDYELNYLPMPPEKLSAQNKNLIMLVTFGSRGATAYANGKSYYLHSLARNVVNTTGAGDFMFACFSESYYSHQNIPKALAIACLSTAEFLEGRKMDCGAEDLEKKIKITENLYIP